MKHPTSEIQKGLGALMIINLPPDETHPTSEISEGSRGSKENGTVSLTIFEFVRNILEPRNRASQVCGLLNMGCLALSCFTFCVCVYV